MSVFVHSFVYVCVCIMYVHVPVYVYCACVYTPMLVPYFECSIVTVLAC